MVLDKNTTIEDVGKLIKGDLKEIAKMPGFRYSNFNGAVSAYKAAKQQRYDGLENEEQLLEALNDKLEALTAIYKSQPQATCIPHLENYIDRGASRFCKYTKV